jgi:phosphoglycerate dehydrogenase-like enzyme
MRGAPTGDDLEILLLERSYRRIEQAFRRVAPDATPLLMRDDGRLLRSGRPVAPEAVHPEVAWASRDLFLRMEDGPVRDFMVTVLKSDGLRWMQSGAAGLDHPVWAMIAGKGVRLTNDDAAAIAIAEFVLSSVLDAFQPNPARRASQAARRWERHDFREIAGTTWLVIGVGNIGREVALRAGAFGAHVIGVRRRPRGDEPVAEMREPAAMREALPRADVVALCAAANRSTQDLVDGAFLAAMKAGSVLVNIARGALVNETALLASLDRGVPAWAILDVFESEPLPVESPLWGHPRVRASAHAAAAGSGTTRRGDRRFLTNLERYLAGEPLDLEVDPATLA